jgi:hypothetical protein
MPTVHAYDGSDSSSRDPPGRHPSQSPYLDDDQHRLVAVYLADASEYPGHRIAGSLAARLARAGKWPVIVVS